VLVDEGLDNGGATLREDAVSVRLGVAEGAVSAKRPGPVSYPFPLIRGTGTGPCPLIRGTGTGPCLRVGTTGTGGQRRVR